MITPETSKQQIESFLSNHFSSIKTATEHQGPAYQEVLQVAEDVALSGGKRLRPYMSMAMYEAYAGEPSEKILPVAAAQEILHMAMLVHDDIMDGDTVRHGTLNVTGRMMEVYEPLIEDEDERRRQAEYAALLVGDLLVGEAHGLTDDLEGFDAKVMRRTRHLFRSALRVVIGGQLHDIEAPFRNGDAVSPRQIAFDKTAHYTFITPLLVGATLAEAPDEELDKLQTIGKKTGIAYQLRDDLLGVFGNSLITGKSTDGDLREGKKTLLTEAFQATATPSDIAEYQALQAHVHDYPKEKAPIKRMRKMLRPARAIIEAEIRDARSDVHRLIGELAIHEDYQNALENLASRSLNRTH